MAEAPTRPAPEAHPRPEFRGLQVLAERLLAEESRIDWVCADEHGDAVLVFELGDGEDQAALTRALAARRWVAARVGDWLQLAPELPLRTGAAVGVRLLAPSFTRETKAAVASLPMGWAELIVRTPDRADARSAALGHGIRPAPSPSDNPESPARPPRPERQEAPAAAPTPTPNEPDALRSRFRTGLSEDQLRPPGGPSDEG